MRIDNLRVLIVDGNLAVGRGLKALIEEIPGLIVVGLATHGARGLKQAALTAPDVVLVDAELPGLCSAAVIKLLRWRLPRVRVIALGIYPERRWAALAVGAHAFVLKDAGYDALRVAIAGDDIAETGIGGVDTGAEAAVGLPTGVAVGSAARPAAPAEERVRS